MYLNFYGLSQSPFHITPDPAFLYQSAAHKEAYASMVYGVDQRKGFIVLTGEVGTGKTTVLRSFLSRLDRAHCRPIYLFNPEITFDELVRVLLQELGGQARKDASSAYLLHKLYWTLVEEYKNQRNVVLLIDEAQNMPIETLERVRMLSNLETTQDKLLQIVLVGQPELDALLGRQELRQLRQRIAVRAALRPLTAEESDDYIRHRLEVAGTRAGSVFTKAAVARLVNEAQGSPRVLNILCDNALIAGFGTDERPIGIKLVKEVIADYHGRKRVFRRSRRLQWAAAAGVVLAAGALLSVLVPGEAAMPTAREEAKVEVTEKMDAGAPGSGIEAAAAPSNPEVQARVDAPEAKGALSESPGIEAMDAPGAAQVLAKVEPSNLTVTSGSSVLTNPAAPPALAEAPATPPAEPAASAATPAAPEPVEITARAPETPETDSEEAAAPDDVAPVEAPQENEVLASVATEAMAPPLPDQLVTEAPAATPHPEAAEQPSPTPARIYQVTEGEFLTQILVEVYGTSSKSLRDKVLAANPQILDEDVIIVGETLALPAWDAAESGPLPDGEDNDKNL